MEIADFLKPERVILDVRARDKAQLMTEIARHYGRVVPDLPPDSLESALLAREELGSTGLGSGFALPHARIENLPHYSGLFMRLGKAIEFDAIDGKPVSRVFALLIPADTASHVAALAAISRRFRDADFVAHLMAAKTAAAAYGLLTGG